MTKLSALIEAAKAGLGKHFAYSRLPGHEATILELCALLEKAEEGIRTCIKKGRWSDTDEWVKTAQETLAAIKQWKEGT